MVYQRNAVRTLYKKLLTLYPREFREQLCESMEQTFNNLFEGRKGQIPQGLFGFVLWMFIETAIGIFEEHILLIKEINLMKNMLTNLRLPTIISSIVVLPFIMMEVVNRRNFNEGFPFPLFGFLWALPILFSLTLMPIVQTIRTGNSLMAKPISLLLRVAFLILIAWFWGALVMDQMPCFLGVPNCD